MQYFGKDPDTIIQPYTKEQVDWLMQTTETWPISLAAFSGHCNNHYPPSKLIYFAQKHEFIFPKITSSKPLQDALLIFTDGSSNGTAAYICGSNRVTFPVPNSSAQIVELNAVAVFFTFPNNAFNLYTDSAFIFYSIPQLETCSQLKSTSTVETLFLQLQTLIRCRIEPFFIGDLHAHSNLPSPLAEGNHENLLSDPF